MERDFSQAEPTGREDRDRREAELCADLRERIAHTRELTRRSKDLLNALAAEPRSFRSDD